MHSKMPCMVGLVRGFNTETDTAKLQMVAKCAFLNRARELDILWEILTQTTRLVLWLSGKDSACSAGQAGDLGSIPGLGRSPGEGNDNPFQSSYQENPMERGAWGAKVHGVAKSQTQSRRLSISITQTNSLPPRCSYSPCFHLSLALYPLKTLTSPPIPGLQSSLFSSFYTLLCSSSPGTMQGQSLFLYRQQPSLKAGFTVTVLERPY